MTDHINTDAAALLAKAIGAFLCDPYWRRDSRTLTDALAEYDNLRASAPDTAKASEAAVRISVDLAKHAHRAMELCETESSGWQKYADKLAVEIGRALAAPASELSQSQLNRAMEAYFSTCGDTADAKGLEEAIRAAR